MKKIILLLLMTVSFSVMFAQKGLHVGVIGGPQFVAQLNKQEFDNPDVRFKGITMRAAFGPTVNYHFTDKLGVGTQFLFSFQGLKYEDRANLEYFRKVTYLKLPILLHVNSSPDKIAGAYFYFGPQFSFAMGKDFEAFGLSLKDDFGGAGYEMYKDIHKTVTIGGAMGFGVLFNIMDGDMQAHLGLRIDGDFTDAFKADDLVAVEENNPQTPEKYSAFDENIGLFAMDTETGERSVTRNVSGLIEIGFKYVLFRD